MTSAGRCRNEGALELYVGAGLMQVSGPIDYGDVAQGASATQVLYGLGLLGF